MQHLSSLPIPIFLSFVASMSCFSNPFPLKSYPIQLFILLHSLKIKNKRLVYEVIHSMDAFGKLNV